MEKFTREDFEKAISVDKNINSHNKIQEAFEELENMAVNNEFVSKKIMSLHNLVDQEIKELTTIPVSPVILSRFDEASEKIMNRVGWKNIIDKNTAQVCLNVVRSALASQKISGE